MLLAEFQRIESYMLRCMSDSAHDAQHVYRVLYSALDIASQEDGADQDVLVAACLLHDIARGLQFRDPSLCHAQEGAKQARAFLLESGWPEDRADHVAACVSTHRFRGDNPPKSPEARILFDADKLDATGATGVARTLLYKGGVEEPLYTVGEDGSIDNGEETGPPSFFREYHFKLKRLYTGFYTARARELAQARERAMTSFVESALEEVTSVYRAGQSALALCLEGDGSL